MNPLSFTSASYFPAKLLDSDIIRSVSNHNIRPIHIQLHPTNRCTLNCSFCSCKNKDDTEMPFSQACNIIDKFSNLGTKAVSLSGGGDPLCHPKINDIIRKCKEKELEVGLVTNGILLDALDSNIDLDWCRISISGENLISENIKKIILKMPHINWAFSYVLVPDNYQNIIKALKIANELNVTHFKIIDDILDNGDSHLDAVKELIKSDGIDDKLVIYHKRKGYTKGTKKCYMSLIKPTIDARGLIFPCCGAQHALLEPDMYYSEDFSMGDKYYDIWDNQKYFNGSICEKCYYGNYNNLLSAMWDFNSLTHRNFV